MAEGTARRTLISPTGWLLITDMNHPLNGAIVLRLADARTLVFDDVECRVEAFNTDNELLAGVVYDHFVAFLPIDPKQEAHRADQDFARLNSNPS